MPLVYTYNRGNDFSTFYPFPYDSDKCIACVVGISKGILHSARVETGEELENKQQKIYF